MNIHFYVNLGCDWRNPSYSWTLVLLSITFQPFYFFPTANCYYSEEFITSTHITITRYFSTLNKRPWNTSDVYTVYKCGKCICSRIAALASCFCRSSDMNPILHSVHKVLFYLIETDMFKLSISFFRGTSHTSLLFVTDLSWEWRPVAICTKTEIFYFVQSWQRKARRDWMKQTYFTK